MLRSMLPSVACPPVLYFSTLAHKLTIFGKTLLNIKCVLWFPLQRLSETSLIFSRIRRNITGYSCQILIKHEFSAKDFRKILKYQLAWKSFRWEPSCSIRTNGRTRRSCFILQILRTRLKTTLLFLLYLEQSNLSEVHVV